jgi:hypothetical protein
MLNVTRVYLACPYSSPDESVRRERHHAANIAAAALMNGVANNALTKIK